MKNKISVILPAFNEEKNILEVLNKITQSFKENLYNGEIIVVDDGSEDKTKSLAEDFSRSNPNIKVLHHPQNRGITEALLTGFENAVGDIIVYLCSDQQSNPLEDIPKLVNKINEGFSMVLGWRQGRRNRIIVSKVGHLLCRSLFGVSFHDMNWIKAYRREVIKDLPLRSDWHRYIPILAHFAGYKIAEVKTNYYPRGHGKSKFGKKRILAGFLDLLAIKFQLSFMKRPMFYFGTLGLIFLGLGVLLGLGLLFAVIYMRFTVQLAKAWYILLLLLFIVGLSFLSLGFLAEFMANITEKLKSLEEYLKKKD